jgi:hypothetical protein
MSDLIDSLVWLPVVVAGGYVLLPFVIYFTQRLEARPDMEPLDLNALPRKTVDYLMASTRELITLGFENPVMVELPNAAPNVTGFLILLANRSAGDMAMVTVMVGDHGPAHQEAFLIEFSTGSADGPTFDTSNSRHLSPFLPSPGTIQTYAWGATDTAELYRLHHHVMAIHGFDGPREVYPSENAPGWLAEQFEELYEANMVRGWLVRTRDRAAFVPTLFGAYRMTWRLIPPVIWVRKLRMGRQTARLLTEVRRTDSEV